MFLFVFKSLMFVRSLFILFGAQKFQMITNRLFKQDGFLFFNYNDTSQFTNKSNIENLFSKIINIQNEQENVIDVIDMVKA